MDCIIFRIVIESFCSLDVNYFVALENVRLTKYKGDSKVLQYFNSTFYLAVFISQDQSNWKCG